MADFRKPDFKIYEDGNPVSEEVVAAVIQITVDDMVDGAAVATIKLRDELSHLSDGTKFKVGAELKIELGYVGETTQVFIGDVTGWKGAFPRRGGQTLTVIAQDRFHRLRRNRMQKTYLEMKDSDAVTEAGQATEGITSVEAAATSVTQDSIIQWNQTAADFCLERASLFGMEVFVDDKKLILREPKLSEAPVATITWHEQLRHFTTSVSLSKQQKQLKVTAWDMVAKEGLEFVAKEGDERNTMGATDSGAKNVASLDGDFNWYATTPAKSTDEVTAYAKGIFHKRSERYVQGEGICEGDPVIRRGTVVELDGLGNLLSGKYYARRVIHTLLVGSGYTTTFRVIRTAVKAPAPPPTEQQESQHEPREEPEALLNPDWGGPGPMDGELDADPHEVGPGLEGAEKEVHPDIKPGLDTDDAPDDPEEEEEEAEVELVPLKLSFRDEDGEPMANMPFELKVGAEVISGMTDEEGRLETEVPDGIEQGELTIWEDEDKSGEAYTWPISIWEHTE